MYVCPSAVLLIFDNVRSWWVAISQKGAIAVYTFASVVHILSNILFQIESWGFSAFKAPHFNGFLCAFCDYFIPYRWKSITFYVLIQNETYVHSIITLTRTSITAVNLSVCLSPCLSVCVYVKNVVLFVYCRKINHYDNNNNNGRKKKWKKKKRRQE